MHEEEKEFSLYNILFPFNLRRIIIFNILIGLVVYFNSLFNPFILDDIQQIVTNPDISNLGSLFSYFFKSLITLGSNSPAIFHIQYRPLLNITYTLLFPFSGSNPFLFHLFQLSFHIANSILIYVLFSKYFKKSIAYILSVIFLIHPINTEAVIYIADLQDVMFVFFGLTAFILFEKYKEKKITTGKLWLLGLFLFISLLFKETGILFLLTLWIYSFYSSKINLKNISVLFSTIFLIYISFRFIASQHVYIALLPSLVQKSSIVERLASMPQIISYYFSTLFLPNNLAIWQEWTVKQVTIQNFYVPLFIDLLIIFGLISFGIKLFKTKHMLRIIYMIFFIWFVIGIVLHLQIIPLDFTVADRYFYSVIIALLGMVGVAVTYFESKIHKYKALTPYLIAIVFILLSIVSINRNAQWESPEKLYSHDVKYVQVSPLMYSNYGAMIMSKGQLSEAKYYLENSVEQDPSIGSNINYLAQWYEYNREYDKAKDLYWRNIHENADLVKYVNIINVSYDGLTRIALVDEKNKQEAKRLALIVLKDFPNDSQALEYLSVAQYFSGEKENALVTIEKLNSIDSTGLSQQIVDRIKANTLTFPRRSKEGNIVY